MDAAAAIVATAVLTALGVLQALVAAGRPYGRFVWGGRHDTLPRRLRIASVVSIVVYVLMAGILIARAVDTASEDPDSMPLEVAVWVLTAYFALGIVFNAASRSPAERAVMAPTSAALAVCALILAIG